MSAVQNATVRVVLVDDHPVVRDGLTALFNAEESLDLVGQAADGAEGLALVEARQPDVVLLDVHLPDMSGLDVLREIRQRHPEVAVVMLTMYDNEAYFIEAMHAGASGYLLKDAPQALIGLALRSASKGGCTVQPRMMAVAARGCDLLARNAIDPETEKIVAQLTPRELEVLRLLARGYQNKMISETLHLAEVTVKKYVQSVVAKLAMPDRTRAALLAARLGLGE